MRTKILVIGTLFAVLACASSPRDGSERRDNRVLTTEEIRNARQSSVLDLIEAERAQWLRTRGTPTLRTRTATDPRTGEEIDVMDSPEVVVYMDGIRFGTAASLRSLPLSGIQELRFLTATEATSRFGTNHPNGAILVVTSR